MRTLTGLISAALLVCTTACSDGSPSPSTPSGAITVGSGRFVTEVRPVEGLNSIAVSGAGHAIVARGDVESLEVTAEDNILPLVDTRVVNGRLMLGMLPGSGSTSSHGITYRIVVRDLREIVGSGSSQIDLPGIVARQLLVFLSGASTLTASGSIERLEITLSGASRCRVPELSARAVVATLSGASVAFVRVSDSLVVTASGASVLEYLGNPTVQAHTSSEAIVRRATTD
jgi:Putative auto-transporter adhesin, head GIN domain